MDQRVARVICLLVLALGLSPAAAQAVEPNGALIRLTTNNYTYRIVGGAPLRIGSCSYTNGCEGRKDVANLNGYRAYPSDGAMINGGSDGGTYRFAGGAPLWVSKCSYGGGCAAGIQVDDYAFRDTAHLKAVPIDSTVIRNFDDGGFYRFAGGAPQLVRCDMGAGCVNPVQLDSGTFAKLGTYTPATPHMRQYPLDGTVVYSGDDNSHYRYAGGSPLPIAPVAGAKVLVDARTFVQSGTATPALPHMTPAPAEATYLVAGTQYYRVAGGAALAIVNCAPLGNCPGAVPVDAATITGLGGGRLLAAPRDGTLVRGLPSNTLWEIVGGYRRQSFVAFPGISVDDGAIGLIPTPPSAPPPVPQAPAVFAPVISSSYTVNRKGTRFTALSVRSAPDGATVTVSCRGRGCPFKKAKRYTVKSGRASALGPFRKARLRNNALVTVKVTGPTGALKQMSFRMRFNKLPKRTTQCRPAGGKTGKC